MGVVWGGALECSSILGRLPNRPTPLWRARPHLDGDELHLEVLLRAQQRGLARLELGLLVLQRHSQQLALQPRARHREVHLADERGGVGRDGGPRVARRQEQAEPLVEVDLLVRHL